MWNNQPFSINSRTNAHSFLFWICNRTERPKNYCVNHLKTIFAGFGNHLFFIKILHAWMFLLNSKVIKQRRHESKPLKKMRGSGYSHTLIWLRDVATRSLWYPGKSATFLVNKTKLFIFFCHEHKVKNNEINQLFQTQINTKWKKSLLSENKGRTKETIFARNYFGGNMK